MTRMQTGDLALRSIAKRRAALDSEEASWIREAESGKLWIELGMVSMMDYLERILGYTPRAALERIRVSRALGDLPLLTHALATGELSYSAVRELTRVATPSTEDVWRESAADKNLRELEELVAGRRPGDLPDDPRDPDLRLHVVRYQVSPATFARLRDARAALDAEHGERLRDDQFVAALCGAALEDSSPAAEPRTRARFQIASVTVCASCQQGYQTGAGATVAIDAAAVARARCDAQHIGSLDSATPARATQDVSPKTRRFVWHRDGGRCSVAGCRSTRNLEIHHVRPRADGGAHTADNLTLLCDAHHVAHHAGTLAMPLAARAPAPRRLDLRDSLVAMGWRRPLATSAVDRAVAQTHVGAAAATDADLLRAALRLLAAS